MNIIKKSTINNNVALKFSILQMTFWCTMGSFNGFVVAYFYASGLSAKFIGLLLSLSTVSAFIGQYIWGRLCDKFNSNKKVFLFANILTYFLFIWVFVLVKSWMVIPAYILLGFVQIPMISNLDTWILKVYSNCPDRFGPIRACGSLAYGIMMVFYGGVVMKFGYSVMLIASAIIIAITFFVGLFTPEAPIFETKTVKANGSVKDLLKSKIYIFIITIAFLIGVGNYPVMNMMALIMESVNGTLQHQGIALFFSAMAQVPLMLYSNKLARFSVFARLLTASIIYLCSFITIGVGNTPIVIIFASLINGIGFGLFLPAFRQAVFENSPKHLHTTAQGIGESCYSSLAGVLSGYLSGFVIQGLGIKILMIGCSAIQLIVVVLFLIRELASQKNRCTNIN